MHHSNHPDGDHYREKYKVVEKKDVNGDKIFLVDEFGVISELVDAPLAAGAELNERCRVNARRVFDVGRHVLGAVLSAVGPTHHSGAIIISCAEVEHEVVDEGRRVNWLAPLMRKVFSNWQLLIT